MSHITLLRIPAELLCHILAFLSDATYDLVRVRETCKTLKALIDNSEMLQYIIDLCYFRMIHVGTHETDVPVAIHRRQLRQQEDAWGTFSYRQKCTLEPMPNFHVVSGVYASFRGNRIHFARLSSVSDPHGVHSWSHPIDVSPLLTSTFCPEQDLLVVMTLSPVNENYAFDIHLRSLATNGIHPKATKSVLKAFKFVPEDNSRNPYRPTNLRINGNYISVQCELRHPLYMTNGASVQMWDWKDEEGHEFVLHYDEYSIDCSFIAEDRFLVSICEREVLELYSITDKSKPPQRTALLRLPSLMDDCLYDDVYIGINPSHGPVFPYFQKFPHQPPCFFHPSSDDQLIVFQIFVTGKMFSFFARSSAIIQVESLPSDRDDHVLPWSAWGPQHTTWFAGGCGNKSYYGFRTVGFVGGENRFSPVPRRLWIRDFNPHNTCNNFADHTTGPQSPLVQGNPITTTLSDIFADPLGCALPYREVISEELFDASDAIMDGNNIFLLNLKKPPAYHTRLEKVDLLIF